MKRLLVISAFSIVALSALAYRPQPVPGWNELSASYADAGKAPIVIETPKDSPTETIQRLSFPSADGSTVKGVFVRPLADGVYPVVVVLHGLGGNKDQMVTHLAPYFIPKGIAIFALDAPFHGERHTQEGTKTLFGMFMAAQKSKVKGDLVAQVHAVDADNNFTKFYVNAVHGGVLDYRLGLDYLDTRKDVDHKRIGVFGYSLGSIMGSILAGVDSRITCSALCVGGDPSLPFMDEMPENLKFSVAEVSPSLFISHAAPHPLFFLNGKVDDVIPKSATDRLFDAAGQPKEIKWYPSGHTLPEDAFKDAVAWSIDHLK